LTNGRNVNIDLLHNDTVKNNLPKEDLELYEKVFTTYKITIKCGLFGKKKVKKIGVNLFLERN